MEGNEQSGRVSDATPQLHPEYQDCEGLRHKSVEYVLAPTSEATLAISDRDSGLWTLVDHLCEGEILSLGYRFYAENGIGEIRARLRLCAKSDRALEKRYDGLRRSLSMAVSCAFPSFDSTPAKLIPMTRQFPLRPSCVPLYLTNPSKKHTPGSARIGLVEPAQSDDGAVFLSERPLAQMKIGQALALLAEANIDTEL